MGRDGGPNREDDDGEESLAAESHVRWPEEKTSPSPRRTSSDADPLGAPVVVRNTSGTRVSPAENDRATDRGPPSRRPAAFDPLENLSDAWRFIRGDDFRRSPDGRRHFSARGRLRGARRGRRADRRGGRQEDRGGLDGAFVDGAFSLETSRRRPRRLGSSRRSDVFSFDEKKRKETRTRTRETTRGRVRRRKRPTNTRASSENPPRRLARRPFRRSTGAGSATCTRR